MNKIIQTIKLWFKKKEVIEIPIDRYYGAMARFGMGTKVKRVKVGDKIKMTKSPYGHKRVGLIVKEK